MRLALQSRSGAGPSGFSLWSFTRWIESSGVGVSESATQFHPPHERRTGVPPVSIFSDVQGFNARSFVSGKSLPEGEGRGEGEGNVTQPHGSYKSRAV